MIEIPGMQGDLVLRLVVPHLRLGKQAPALKRMKHRALTAQRFHRAVANEVLHVAAPTFYPELSKACFQDGVITILRREEFVAKSEPSGFREGNFQTE
jgi:hypothetical protein